MSLRIVQLGKPRSPGEGLRLGTVRRPPRGVPKAEFASRDFYDLWMPTLSPSAELMKLGLSAQSTGDIKDWAAFAKKFRAEIAASPDALHLLDLLVPPLGAARAARRARRGDRALISSLCRRCGPPHRRDRG